MTWNLFIDDERNLDDVTWAPWQVREKYRNEEWVICRTKIDVINAIFDHDKTVPSFISFDHDLGDDEPTGAEITRWVVEMDLDGVITIPADFDFYVHSKNPIGKSNIEGYLKGYLKAKARAAEVPHNEARFDELYSIAMEDDEGDITVGKPKR